ncbi:T. brucei spp.-specific protein [Trypanosoma brucei gambiense DAL972]|uniref:T. brucei spp.-specific protein n=1 Tax=Trypanosoma brucei gambiense (strain MHOM/CI/86/DAL972) TaxID=679716 RepID=D0A974_TRYB9|nr:T. brucei spp.-specific protein [Trypanosoma brucei gambiense DAL972]CBH18225.1 T. brucei spp.-specific protein [Trypanosoma brucei gambiense DAL972]|eukprot:XP_011780489.1 T. brucei spp.-specific protein [Trypanosoma brucei gambiense DAL972]
MPTLDPTAWTTRRYPLLISSWIICRAFSFPEGILNDQEPRSQKLVTCHACPTVGCKTNANAGVDVILQTVCERFNLSATRSENVRGNICSPKVLR